MASSSSTSASTGGEGDVRDDSATAVEPAALRGHLLLGVLQRLQVGEATVVVRARNVCRSWRSVVSDQIAAAARRLRLRQQEKPPPRSSRRGRDGMPPPPRHRRRAHRKPAEFRVICR